jgi:ABC-type lipoprotein export system ATPase subunit
MTAQAEARGARWRLWDLHVHTPSSLVQQYGRDDDQTWEKYLTALEALPADMSVVGINDYWFLDGYRRVVAAKQAGRLSNLEAIFPVVEMRLDQFGGVDGHLKRVNLHVIFDPDLGPDVIEAQFLSQITGQFSLTPGTAAPSWKGVVTRESLIDLGTQVIEGAPPAKRSEYGSPLIEGFNNLNVSMDSVRKALDNTHLKGKTLLSLGKTEWAAIKWTDGSVANKKSLITEAQFLFTAYEDASSWASQVAEMKAAGVNHRILDCSDAHTWAQTTKNKDRLGNCSTWMNNTPTFAGLLHALEEFDQRVFVGLEPEARARHRTKPEQYIDSVRIGSRDKAKATAFNYELPLNPGFVAIVGNKGQGKSALLDCIALAGNSSRSDEFAFLTTQRFLNPTNRTARLYDVSLSWLDGSARTANFGDRYSPAEPVRVEYLPQRYVERVCTIDPLSDASHEFENELREVLFTHIPDDERAGETSFDALLDAKTEAARMATTRLRAELSREAKRYVDLCDFARDNRTPDVENKLKLKRVEIAKAEDSLRAEKLLLEESDAAGSNDAATKALRKESTAARARLEQERQKRASHLQELGKIQRDITNATELERRSEAIVVEAGAVNQDWTGLSGDGRTLVAAKLDASVLQEWRAASDARTALQRAAVQECDDNILELEAAVASADQKLASADGARELARQRVLQVEERLVGLKGTIEAEDSEAWLLQLLERTRSATTEIAESQQRLIAVSRSIHEALQGELRAVTDLYGPASRYIEASEVVQKAGLEFKAELSIVGRLQELRGLLDGRKSPDLLNWLIELPQRIDGQEWSDLAIELEASFLRLNHERGAEDGRARHPADALRANVDLTLYLAELLGLGWIEVRFGLTGNGLPLSLLSPGQRGLVLAIFYLIVDRRTTPLLLDQPEENLDNATIATLLVPAIQDATLRRQTIIVTHNANLAIVGDADQIVHCTVDNQTSEFGVTAGCISELDTAKAAIDILEGTKPAFDTRRHKYDAFPSLV